MPELSTFRATYAPIVKKHDPDFTGEDGLDLSFVIGRPKLELNDCYYPRYVFKGVRRDIDFAIPTVTLRFSKNNIGISFVLFEDILGLMEECGGGFESIRLNGRLLPNLRFLTLEERFVLLSNSILEDENELVFLIDINPCLMFTDVTRGGEVISARRALKFDGNNEFPFNSGIEGLRAIARTTYFYSNYKMDALEACERHIGDLFQQLDTGYVKDTDAILKKHYYDYAKKKLPQVVLYLNNDDTTFYENRLVALQTGKERFALFYSKDFENGIKDVLDFLKLNPRTSK